MHFLRGWAEGRAIRLIKEVCGLLCDVVVVVGKDVDSGDKSLSTLAVLGHQFVAVSYSAFVECNKTFI